MKNLHKVNAIAVPAPFFMHDYSVLLNYLILYANVRNRIRQRILMFWHANCSYKFGSKNRRKNI